MEFTHLCAGDLGIIVSGAVVALLFEHRNGYHVFDVFAGGHPTVHDTRPDALNAMLAIARKRQGGG
jgi:hypothetical protein